jgi:Tfp pilus assembly protein PilF
MTDRANAQSELEQKVAALLARGETEAALYAASAACRAAPERPQAHYVYGQAWSALGDHARAERAFAEAIKLAPRWADAWINYGVARYRLGHIEDAKTAMRQALLAAPGHPAAMANLGAFQRISGESEAGEALLRQAVAAEPTNAGARLNLAAQLMQEERADEALAVLPKGQAPVDDRVALRHWRLQESLALLQLRRFAEARAALASLEALGPVPNEVAPLWRWRRVLLALGEDQALVAGEEATLMEAALREIGPNATPEHAIMAHFDLAKFWSGRNEPGRAFAHWIEGHKLLAQSQPFSRADHRAFVDANIALFSRARFSDGPRADNHDPAPVFIVGMPRSGTTLCEQILAAHRDVHGAGERSALGQTFARLGGAEGIVALGRESLNAAASHYLAELHALAAEKSRVIDKMPGNFNHLGLVGLMLPGAKIIHCLRDPRDIGLSIFTFRFHGAHPYAHDLSDLGWYIGEHARLMAHWKAALPNAILAISLSDWVDDFDATLARLLAHLELPPDPNCARFYEAERDIRTVSRTQVRQPINARGIGRWRAYVKELSPLIAELESAGLH